MTYLPPSLSSDWDGAIATEPRLPFPPGTGRLGVYLLGVFSPQTDLLYTGPDDPLVRETWPQSDRSPLLNIGGHRVAIAGQPITFDGSDSQTDEDGIITTLNWDFGDGGNATGLAVTHTYASPGLYTVTASLGSTSTSRWVRVVAAPGEAMLPVLSLDDLSGSVETGWRCQVTIDGAVPDLVPGRVVILTIADTMDTSWRDQYQRSIRDLARRTAARTLPPPLPMPGENTAHYTELGMPSGPCWGEALAFASQIRTASAKTGVPPNLLLAVIAVRSCGDPQRITLTGNNHCPKAYGLAQLAPGCSWYAWSQEDLLDPGIAIMALAKELAARYTQCGRWDDAVRALLTNDCQCDTGKTSLAIAPCSLAETIMQAWEEADRALGGGGNDAAGNVIFCGYVLEGSVIIDAEHELTRVTLVDSLAMLQSLAHRQEAFFESDQQQFAGGGTFMVDPPLRTAQAIHHLVTKHTNVPLWHDIILDWSGPRMRQITAPEGNLASTLQQWAKNDFSWAYGDRRGRIRFERRPHYRPKSWHDQIGRYAPVIDPSLAMEVITTERAQAGKVGWVKLAGMDTANACQVFGEYPCGGPPQPDAREWVFEQGYHYDDYRTLCEMAAYHHAYLNRRWDVQVTLPWRHDLDLGDIVRFPHRDPSGRYSWHGITAPLFVIRSISHQYDPAQARLTSTLSLEQLTTATPCECEEPTCPERPSSFVPCPECPRGSGLCGGQLLEDGWRQYWYRLASGTYLENDISEDSTPINLPLLKNRYRVESLVQCNDSHTSCWCEAAQVWGPEVVSETVTSTLAPCQRRRTYSGIPQVSAETATPGLLTAQYSMRDETQRAMSWRYGDASGGNAAATILEEQISWFNVVVRTMGTGLQKLKVKVRPVAGTPGARGVLAIVRTPRPAETDPFGLVGTALDVDPIDGPDGGVGRYGSTEVIAIIEAEPSDDWLTYTVDLPGSPSGIFYAIGLARAFPGPPAEYVVDTQHKIFLEGSWERPGGYGCAPQVLITDNPQARPPCCLPFTCLAVDTTPGYIGNIPGDDVWAAKGPVRAWLGAGELGLRSLEGWTSASNEERCNIATLLSGQEEPASTSYITAGGSEQRCSGQCTFTETPVWTSISRSEQAGSISCEIALEWDDSACHGGGPAVTPPPWQCYPSESDPSGGTRTFTCASGTTSPSWTPVAGDPLDTGGDTVELTATSSPVSGIAVSDVRIPQLDNLPVSYRLAGTIHLQNSAKVRLYLTDSQDWSGENWFYLGPANYHCFFQANTGAGGEARWSLATPASSVDAFTALAPSSIGFEILWNRQTRTFQVTVGQDTRFLSVNSPPPPASPFLVAALETQDGVAQLGNVTLEIREGGGTCPRPRQGEGEGPGPGIGCLAIEAPYALTWQSFAYGETGCTGISASGPDVTFNGQEGCSLYSPFAPGFASDGLPLSCTFSATVSAGAWATVTLGLLLAASPFSDTSAYPELGRWSATASTASSFTTMAMTVACGSQQQSGVAGSIDGEVSLRWDRSTKEITIAGPGTGPVTFDASCIPAGALLIPFIGVGVSSFAPGGTTTSVTIRETLLRILENGGCDVTAVDLLTPDGWVNNNNVIGPPQAGSWSFPGSVITGTIAGVSGSYTGWGIASYRRTSVPVKAPVWSVTVEGHFTGGVTGLAISMIDNAGGSAYFGKISAILHAPGTTNPLFDLNGANDNWFVEMCASDSSDLGAQLLASPFRITLGRDHDQFFFRYESPPGIVVYSDNIHPADFDGCASDGDFEIELVGWNDTTSSGTVTLTRLDLTAAASGLNSESSTLCLDAAGSYPARWVNLDPVPWVWQISGNSLYGPTGSNGVAVTLQRIPKVDGYLASYRISFTTRITGDAGLELYLTSESGFVHDHFAFHYFPADWGGSNNIKFWDYCGYTGNCTGGGQLNFGNAVAGTSVPVVIEWSRTRREFVISVGSNTQTLINAGDGTNDCAYLLAIQRDLGSGDTWLEDVVIEITDDAELGIGSGEGSGVVQPPGPGTGTASPDPLCAVAGACGNWPSAEAINARISLSEQQNGRSSPLHGMGEEFLRLGAKYGVNPGIVAAILQRESQLAADGSYLPINANNFGGLTGSGPCGSLFYIDRNWAVFCDPAQGLEGVFARLREPQYTSTAGTMEAVMMVYSPPFENDWEAMWQTFRAVAAQLGITIEPSTPVYSSAPECTSGPGGIPIPSPPPGGSGYGGYWTMFEYALHAVGARITQGPWGSYSHSRCDCYDFGCPVGTPIYPVLPGTVIVSEATSGVYAPNVIVVQTQYGNLRYAHLSSRAVSTGQQVGLETLLGYSGSAGTGPHLHLGLDGGTSSMSLDQVLATAGVALGAFPWA